ncbi:hypothetical protein [Desulfitobacterium hafniense]|uniref:hypothetical protein n=1 Tax=Desulfitobacterium hafniense TaxID=49338 RepID=UPI0000544634|nr:hypothetical protein [Desulfitobacterium hafniense]
MCKSKSLGRFSGVSERGVAGWDSLLGLLFPSWPGRLRHGRLFKLVTLVGCSGWLVWPAIPDRLLRKALKMTPVKFRKRPRSSAEKETRKT